MNEKQKSVVALRHLAFEDLGLLAPILRERNYSIAYRDAGVDPIDDEELRDAELLIVLGGPIGVYETRDYPFLFEESRIIERRLARDLPVLGICLGAQMMASALGARVYPGGQKEIGWGSLEITEAGRAGPLAPLAGGAARVLHWHGDTFDLPSQAIRLASTPLFENQAFQFGRNGLALQFHLEVEPRRIEQWLIGHRGELGSEGISPCALRSATAGLDTLAQGQAEAVFGDWLDRING